MPLSKLALLSEYSELGCGFTCFFCSSYRLNFSNSFFFIFAFEEIIPAILEFNSKIAGIILK